MVSARFPRDHVGSRQRLRTHETIDERDEVRHAAVSSTAVLEFRGRKHVVRLINISPSGAMVIFPHTPNIGERLTLQLLDRGVVSSQVRWVKDGRIGLSFAGRLD